MARRRYPVRQAELATDLMLAPAVIAMRWPLMLAEAQGGNPFRPETVQAVVEKTAAVGLGVIAAQFALAQSAAEFWTGIFAGKSQTSFAQDAFNKAAEAAMRPMAAAVKKNHRRLRRRSTASA